jgi:hypothetical protein
MKFRLLLLSLFLLACVSAHAQGLPFATVFKGQPRFDSLVNQTKAKADTLRALPLGERVAWFGRVFVGTPYKGFTLEIDDSRGGALGESQRAGLLDVFRGLARAGAHGGAAGRGMDAADDVCASSEIDRYWGGKCTGSYLSPALPRRLAQRQRAARAREQPHPHAWRTAAWKTRPSR